uniref:Uncharacterized protein n=1 Tax=Alexandrium catenella TaxID=2925 RepID=A0A7S1MCC1_ALECA
MAPKAMKSKVVVSRSAGSAFQKALRKRRAAGAAATLRKRPAASSVVKGSAGDGGSKKQRTEAAQGSAEGKAIDVTVLLASGSQLAVLPARPAWTGAEVKAALSERLEAGARVEGLLSGLEAFEDHQTVGEVGLGGSLELQAVLGRAKPALHLVEPCSAKDLSRRHGGWCYGAFSDDDGEEEFDCFCLRTVTHKGMDTAPPATSEVVRELREALARDLQDNKCRRYDIVVISNAGPDTLEACCRGLAISPEDRRMSEEGEELRHRAEEGKGCQIWKETKVSRVDVSGSKEINWFEPLAASRKVMGRLLTEHFRFHFCSYDRAPKPTLLGGVAKDGSIVGIVTGDTPY